VLFLAEHVDVALKLLRKQCVFWKSGFKFTFGRNKRDCEDQSIETREMLLKLRHIKLQMLKLWSCIGGNEKNASR
jgi:hypothetical protein